MRSPSNSTLIANSNVLTACTICSQPFKTQSALRHHLTLYHSLTTRFRCSDCGKVLKSRQNLLEHRAIHRELKPHVCKYEGCRKRFRQASLLFIHKRIHRTFILYPVIVEELSEPLKLTDCLMNLEPAPVAAPTTQPGVMSLPHITSPQFNVTLPSLHFED